MITPINPLLYINNKPKIKLRDKNFLAGDTVSFGNLNEYITAEQIETAKEKLQILKNNRYFPDDEIDDIVHELSPKSYNLLDEITNTINNPNDILSIIRYINTSNQKETELKTKFQQIRGLESIMRDLSENRKYKFPSLYKDIINGSTLNINPDGSIEEITTLVQLLKSDILNPHKTKEIKPLKESIAYIFDTIEHSFDKIENSLNSPVSDLKESMLLRDIAVNFTSILTAARCLSKDTFNEIWYNRQSDLSAYYYPLLKMLTASDYKTLYDICTKTHQKNANEYAPISLNNKILVLNLLSLNRMLSENNSFKMDNSLFQRETLPECDLSYINIDKLKVGSLLTILMSSGISKNEAVKYVERYKEAKKDNFQSVGSANFWDMDYIYLFAGRKDLNLKEIITQATLGRFQNYIHNPLTKQGAINTQTAKLFEKNNIDYKKWLNPRILSRKEDFISNSGDKKTLHVEMWKRIPQQSIFDGNYTTCCTGIGKIYGESFPLYMLNTAFQMLEIKSDDGKTIGMSRLFLANIDNKPSLIVDNIEVNNKFSKNYLTDKTSKIKYREMIFDYVRDFAKTLNKDQSKDLPIYFSSNYFKIKDIDLGLEKSKNYIMEPIGIFPNNVYINSLKGPYFDNLPYNYLYLININKTINPSN